MTNEWNNTVEYRVNGLRVKKKVLMGKYVQKLLRYLIAFDLKIHFRSGKLPEKDKSELRILVVNVQMSYFTLNLR